jgi:hypothetical protein
MAKAASLKVVEKVINKIPHNLEVAAEAKRHIEEAARLLRSLGRDYEKAAWMIEDTLHYAFSEKENSDFETGANDENYAASGVDWASLVQAEELFRL